MSQSFAPGYKIVSIYFCLLRMEQLMSRSLSLSEGPFCLKGVNGLDVMHHETCHGLNLAYIILKIFDMFYVSNAQALLCATKLIGPTFSLYTLSDENRLVHR